VPEAVAALHNAFETELAEAQGDEPVV
jgi:hypothetical protein